MSKTFAKILENMSGRFRNKTLMSVDIQPEYESFFNFSIFEFIGFISNNYKNNRMRLLYNGQDTMGMVSEEDYKWWLIENGLDENIVDEIEFYDKGYAFFRYCIDSSIEEEDIVKIVRYMIKNNINDSSEMDENDWRYFLKYIKYKNRNVKELLQFSDDLINIPDVMDFLKGFNNIILFGGGQNECLKEIEIALKALKKPYKSYKPLIY